MLDQWYATLDRLRAASALGQLQTRDRNNPYCPVTLASLVDTEKTMTQLIAINSNLLEVLVPLLSITEDHVYARRLPESITCEHLAKAKDILLNYAALMKLPNSPFAEPPADEDEDETFDDK